MTDVRVHEVDLADESLLRAWWEVGRAASQERAFDAWPAWEVSRVALPRQRSDASSTLTVARVGDEVVGAGILTSFLLDNTHAVDAAVHVAPEHRRRGIGRTLLRDLERRTQALGRTTVLGTAYTPVGAESPGSCFAAAEGYAVASHEETKLVDLTTAPAASGWDALGAEVDAHLAGYRVETFEHQVPEHRVEEFCSVLSTFMSHIPLGDLDLQDAEWTPQRLRDHERRCADIGRTWVVALGITPDDRVCGFSELAVDDVDPRHATVGGTLVLPRHRGRRLGLGMKLATHRRVQELFEACQHVETGNAGVNAPMNAVNERLGYRVVERCLDVQRMLGGGAA